MTEREDAPNNIQQFHNIIMDKIIEEADDMTRDELERATKEVLNTSLEKQPFNASDIRDRYENTKETKRVVKGSPEDDKKEEEEEVETREEIDLEGLGEAIMRYDNQPKLTTEGDYFFWIAVHSALTGLTAGVWLFFLGIYRIIDLGKYIRNNDIKITRTVEVRETND